MRVGIREQLAVVVLLASFVPLAVLAIATWVYSRNFVVGVKSQDLSLTASVKAAQISSDLILLQSTCATIVTRVLFQNTLRSFYLGNGNATSYNWTIAYNDLFGGLSSGGFAALLQVKVFSKNQTGDAQGLLNVTTNAPGIILPYTYPNGSSYILGDAGLGYPPPLYPNITYTTTSTPDPADPATNETLPYAFPDFPLNESVVLFLGPMQVNDSYAMVSLTFPIIDNQNSNYVLGYMTVVAAATSLMAAVQSREGLDKTGTFLLVGPDRPDNHFEYQDRPATANYSPSLSELATVAVRYVFPPDPAPGQTDRHTQYKANLTEYGSSNFTMGTYKAILDGFGKPSLGTNNASSIITTTNENHVQVAVGYARPQSTLVDWLVLVEQSHSEAWAPITTLRSIILACVFGTVGLVLIAVLPLAHFSVRPIRRLRDATEKSIAPSGYVSAENTLANPLNGHDNVYSDKASNENGALSDRSQNGGFLIRLWNKARPKQKHRAEGSDIGGENTFKIPMKVPDGKHFLTDELTELTGTFNDMTDQLLLQYTGLEEKVAERTRELVISKRAAEAANESKTLFIANISHELRTPLNGILGMCAVCMGEDDLLRIKRSLQVVYKSGDLLLHLLNDLLTFSKNQIGQQLALEEKEFRLADIKSQIAAIFDKQAREKRINLEVRFNGVVTPGPMPESDFQRDLPTLGPNGSGRLKDMCLWGDQHRILQVIINLVGNSLKFTPDGGKVEVRIVCADEVRSPPDAVRNSVSSRQSSQRKSRALYRNGSGKNTSQISNKQFSSVDTPVGGTALLINPMDPEATPYVRIRERSPTPPPANAKTYVFEFEVEDTGPGIPEHFQQRVFEPFVQGDLGLNKKYAGTGLGLSICSQLATLMGGEISLTSTVGVGTTFKLRVPLKYVKDKTPSVSSSELQGTYLSGVDTPYEDPPAAGKVAAAGIPKPIVASSSPAEPEISIEPRLVGLSRPFFSTPVSPSKNPDPKEQLTAINTAARSTGARTRVLVAEDNLVNQEVVLRMLKLEDLHDVVVARDGQEAYDLVKKSIENGELFDLIFMDIQMPNLDGLESTRLIRRMGYSAPIVALTAFVEESNVKDCYDSGMNMFLSKPIRRSALKQVLNKFATISEETAISPP